MKKTVKILSVLMLMVMAFSIIACGPASDPADAKAALEENGYTVMEMEGDNSLIAAGLALAGIDDVVTIISASNGEDGITIMYFESSSDAKDELEDVKKYLSEENEDDDNYVLKQSGKMIYYGTEAAIKAAR